MKIFELVNPPHTTSSDTVSVSLPSAQHSLRIEKQPGLFWSADANPSQQPQERLLFFQEVKNRSGPLSESTFCHGDFITSVGQTNLLGLNRLSLANQNAEQTFSNGISVGILVQYLLKRKKGESY